MRLSDQIGLAFGPLNKRWSNGKIYEVYTVTFECEQWDVKAAHLEFIDDTDESIRLDTAISTPTGRTHDPTTRQSTNPHHHPAQATEE